MVNISGIKEINRELNNLKEIGKSDFKKYRNKKFRQCILRQYENDLFLREFYDSYGIHQSDLPRTLDEIQKLPIITGKFIEEAKYEKKLIIPEESFLKSVHTYGSTGTAKWITYSKNAAKRLWADLFIRMMYFADIDPFKTSYWITHYTPEKDEWVSHLSVEVVINNYLREKGIDASTSMPFQTHIQRIKEFKPHSILSGPNYLLSLASFAKKEIEVPKVVAGGQYFDEEVRKYVEDAFNANMIGFYPTTENGVIGVEDIKKTGYHIWSDEHELEILDKNNERVSEGERGKVVITTFGMDGSSVIRYELGDEVTYLGESYNPNFPLIKEIRRIGAAPIGDAKVPYAHIEDIGINLRKEGIPLINLQLSKRRELDRKERPILRLELKQLIKIEDRARELLLRNQQIKYLLEVREIHEPIIEIYKAGELSKGKFKIPIYSDV